MAQKIGTVICMGVILIIMSIMFRNPGGIAGAIIFCVCYSCCMMIKGDSSNNSSTTKSGVKHIDINRKDAVLIICPNCQLESIYKNFELKICRKCGQNLE